MNFEGNKEDQERTICQAGIFNLGNKLQQHKLSVEDIGDYIPGNVMVQDLSRMVNTYMNKSGCEILRHSKEELEELGPDYFNLFFPAKEIAVLKVELTKFIQLNDTSKVYSFFQRVRPNPDVDYKWYLTNSRLYPKLAKDTALKVMHVSVEVNQLSYVGKKLNYLCDQDEFVIKNYDKYALLSCREKEIIKLIVGGNHSYTISEMLFISLNTVNNHRKNILNKLKLKSLSELIKFAIAFNLL
ncbi:response regulator transcription factor [Mucilaginibacter sp. McL0603]|uniref:response regulator transcription factor n=1 Tax=Mucilaginibacter sp. McL0603 TaxID=3415670 RepID=UPI003CF6D230